MTTNEQHVTLAVPELYGAIAAGIGAALETLNLENPIADSVSISEGEKPIWLSESNERSQ